MPCLGTVPQSVLSVSNYGPRLQTDPEIKQPSTKMGPAKVGIWLQPSPVSLRLPHLPSPLPISPFVALEIPFPELRGKANPLQSCLGAVQT